MANILMMYETVEGQTERIVQQAAVRAIGAGHTVVIGRVADTTAEQLASADAVLLAASVHLGRHSPDVARFIGAHLDRIATLPALFLSVSLSAISRDAVVEADAYREALLSETGWRPAFSASVAGALRYSRYGFAKRLMMKQIARSTGLPTDTSRDHEFTDWEELGRVVEAFLVAVNEAQSVPQE
jgi:menaquinone-dependent protoporphyrinogen oxidase